MNSHRCFAVFLVSLTLAGMIAPACAQQNTADALSALVASAQAQPDNIAAQRAVENAVGEGLPGRLPSTLLPSLPVETEAAADDLGLLIVPKPYLTTAVTEPRHGQSFAKITYLYLPNGQAGLTQFCQVHYTMPDDAPLAARMARLLSLAHRTLVQKTSRGPEGGDTPFHVWLCRGGDAGGEQWGRNLYFYDLDAPRSSIEWIREVVHEYSHLALPAIGGYQDPEYWANGYLGERLIIRWFQRLPDGPAIVGRAWGDFSGAANFDRLLITPALSLYRQIGPNPKWLARRDAAGMRYLIGQALSVDDTQGARTLGGIFSALPSAREATAADWGEAVSRTIKHTAMVRRP